MHVISQKAYAQNRIVGGSLQDVPEDLTVDRQVKITVGKGRIFQIAIKRKINNIKTNKLR